MKYDEDGRPIKAIDSDPIKGIRPRRQAFGYDVEHSLDSMHFFKELIVVFVVNFFKFPFIFFPKH